MRSTRLAQLFAAIIGAGGLVVLFIRAAFAAFGDVGTVLKLLPLPVAKFVSTPDGTLFLLLFGVGVIWWAVRHPLEAPDVASLHVANTRREGEIAVLRKQLGRRLSAEQKEILRRHLEPLTKRWNATHPSYAAWLGIAVHAASGSDSDDYKADFDDAFRSMSFHLGRFGMLTDGEALDGRERYGVWVRWNSERESLPVGEALVEALRRCEIDVTPLDLEDASFVELIIYRRRPDPIPS